MLGFKFGTFIDIDHGTKNMDRVDVAKIKVSTDALKLIDSAISVMVLGQKFTIRVVEQVGEGVVRLDPRTCNIVQNLNEPSCNGSDDDGSRSAVGGQVSEEGGESDWSQSREGALVAVCQHNGKRNDTELVINDSQRDVVSVTAPIFLGNNLGGELLQVNVSKENKDLNLGYDRALVVVPQETESMLVGVQGSSSHVSTTPVIALPAGSGNFNLGSDAGPLASRPKVLRTKKGDLAISNPDGGGFSNVPLNDAHRALGPCLSGPLPSIPLEPTRIIGGSLPSTVLHNDSNSFITDKVKRGRTKSTSKMPNPFPTGNFLYKFHETRKGGYKPKKKKASRGPLVQQPSLSNESDPIEVSEEVCQQNRFCNLDGINLEVVLPLSCDGGGVGRSTDSLRPVASSMGSGNSGLGGVLGVSLPLRSEVPFSGGMVDKDRGDAHHVIDILEDIGIVFHGQGDDDVVRSMRMEGRDRLTKSDLVQGNGLQ
jgi:hypothetical protein